MLASDINLVPITEDQKDTATVKDICRQLINAGEMADPFNFNGKRVDTVSGECLKLDMRSEEDRKTYADLAAEAVAFPDSLVILWEERVKCDDGGLVIYLCCVRKQKLPSTSI